MTATITLRLHIGGVSKYTGTDPSLKATHNSIIVGIRNFSKLSTKNKTSDPKHITASSSEYNLRPGTTRSLVFPNVIQEAQ